MSPSRPSAAEVAKLLEAAGQPIYVLDAQRRIVFYNRAFCDWSGCKEDELAGRECRYHSNVEVKGTEALAAALCPPPEVFAGRRATAPLIPASDDTSDERRADFVPLVGADEQVAGVIVFLSAQPATVCDGPAGEEPAAIELHARLQRFRRELRGRHSIERLLGDSPAMKCVRAQVELAAGSRASVLVSGAPGSGRQHVARCVHYGSGEPTPGALVPLACALLGPELLQSTIRALARPHLGTSAARPASILLVDVDSLPGASQLELAGLLMLAEIPVRFLGTSREPLVELAARGAFRHDLACLLSTISIGLPRLSERAEDLPLLAQWFLEQANARGTKQVSGFSPEALDRLASYDWPGEVAELEAAVNEAHARAEGHAIAAGDLPSRIELAAEAAAHPRREDEPIVLEEFMGRIERELIERALARAKGNKSKAARLLGMTRPRLYRRMVQLGLEGRKTVDGNALRTTTDD